MIKLLLTWDIAEGKESAYMEFVVHELSPGLSKLGLTVTDAWYTMAGLGPQVIIGAVADDRQALDRLLQHPQWQQLQQKLLEVVVDFRLKLTTPQGLFQM